jgi:predicted DCC family thiol-disulfide oxidoreductase YuxK
MTGPGRATLIYDGACAFCRRWVGRLHRCDGGALLEMVPYQSPDLERRFPAVSREDCARRVHLVDARGVVYRGAAAGREALRRLPGGRLWSLPFGLPGGMTVAERLYDWGAYRFGPLGHAAAARHDREVTETPTLLDTFMPAFDFGHRHAIVVAAPPARVADAAEGYSLASDGSTFARLLFRLRGLAPPSGNLRAAGRAMGLTVLAEEPGRELILGVAGRFWAIDERANLISPPDAQAFVGFSRPGQAKAAMSLRFEPLADGRTRLGTETRVKCVDAAAYRRFALYWALIGPFSAWLRHDLLRGIARRALRDS